MPLLMRFLAKFMTFILAATFFVGSFYYEFYFSQPQAHMSAGQVSVMGKDAMREGQRIVSADTNKILSLNDNIVVRLAPHSSVVVQKLPFEKSGFTSYSHAQEVVIFLEEGHLWVNTYLSAIAVRIETPMAEVSVKNSIADVLYENQKAVITSVLHEAKVELIHNGITLNAFLLPAQTQATIFDFQVQKNAEELKRLLYSKLIKEFQYSVVNMTEWGSSAWVLYNHQADDDKVQTFSRNQLKFITSRGQKMPAFDTTAYQAFQIMVETKDFLTIAPDKKQQQLQSSVFDYLHDSEYLMVFGRANEANDRLSYFKQTFKEIYSKNSPLQDSLRKELWVSYQEIAFVLPDDPLYEVKSSLRELLIDTAPQTIDGFEEKFLLNREFLHYSYELSGKNSVQAKTSLEYYYRNFSSLLQKNSMYVEEMKHLISEDNQILANLLRQHYQFYDDRFFAIASELEKQWLNILPEGNEKSEERQTLAVTKIDFLKALQRYFLEGKVSLEQSRLIAFRLINEMKDLQTTNEVGVSELFALRLKDYGQFLRFLNSIQFADIQGSSFQKKYEDFLASQQEEISIEQAVEEFLGEQTFPSKTLTPADVVSAAMRDFASVHIENLVFAPYVDLNERFLEVTKAELNGVSFTARYDWDRKLISEVLVNNEPVVKNPVRLEIFAQIMASREGGNSSASSLDPVIKPEEVTPGGVSLEPSFTSSPPEDSSNISKTERVARILLIQKMKNKGILVKNENIIVEDATSGIFVIKEASLIKDSKLVFTFHFKNKENMAEKVQLITPEGVQGVAAVVEFDSLVEALKMRSTKN